MINEEKLEINNQEKNDFDILNSELNIDLNNKNDDKLSLDNIVNMYNDNINKIENNNKISFFDENEKKTFKPIFKLNSLSPFEFWDYIGSPMYVCAPMVDQSELAFRLLTRRYNCQLAYTPMVHSVIFTTCEKYKNKWLSDIDHSLESPTFMQFCGHDPEILLRAAKMVEGKVEGIDLNLGCPQGIAKRGNYGSFLLDNTELVLKILGYLANNIKESAITCKIRLFPDLNKTYQLVKDIEKAGVKVLTVHGRTKTQKSQNTSSCNWDAIKKIKELVKIPIISNGGIETYEDVKKCLEYTKSDAVMSSEAILENPGLFDHGKVHNVDDLALELINISDNIKSDIDMLRSHLFKMMYKACQNDVSLNQRLAQSNKYNEFTNIVKEIKASRINIKNSEKFGWYRRYRNDLKIQENEKGIEKELLLSDKNCEEDYCINNMFG